MTSVIGLDISLTSTGYSGFGSTGTFTSKLKGVERLDDLAIQLRNYLLSAPNDVVLIIEGYSFGSRASQAHAIGEIGGVMRLEAFRAGIAYVEVPPTCRAKFATGRGNASKNEVISAISARTGITWSGKGADDEADAWILEEMALVKLGRERFEWPKVNLEALDKVDWAPLTGTESPDAIKISVEVDNAFKTN